MLETAIVGSCCKRNMLQEMQPAVHLLPAVAMPNIFSSVEPLPQPTYMQQALPKLCIGTHLHGA